MVEAIYDRQARDQLVARLHDKPLTLDGLAASLRQTTIVVGDVVYPVALIQATAGDKRRAIYSWSHIEFKARQRDYHFHLYT